MEKTSLLFQKYNFDNVKVQILILVIPVIYHYFYFNVSDYQNYFDYMNLSWVHKLMSYMYYAIGIGSLVATLVLVIKTSKGMVRYIDYLIRAIMIGSYAIRFFIIFPVYEFYDNFNYTPFFLVSIANFLSWSSWQDMLILVTSIISLLRIIIDAIRGRQRIVISKSE